MAAWQLKKKGLFKAEGEGQNMVEMLIKFWKSLKYALNGVKLGFYSRKNVAALSITAVLLAVLLIWLGTSKIRFAIIMAAWITVVIVEIINTAVESVIDALHPGFSMNMGRAKDMMAGAVFLTLFSATMLSFLMIWDPLVLKLAKIFGGG